MREKMIKVPYSKPNSATYWDVPDFGVKPAYKVIEVPESIYDEWVKRGEDVHWNAYAMAFRKDCGIGEFDETVIVDGDVR